jgi:hypothetical protein
MMIRLEHTYPTLRLHIIQITLRRPIEERRYAYGASGFRRFGLSVNCLGKPLAPVWSE